jgi:hypothetical protein
LRYDQTSQSKLTTIFILQNKNCLWNLSIRVVAGYLKST